MSVFTPVSRAELEPFLAGFDLGRLLEYRDIIGGAENSNFFVATEQGQFVLTLVERGPVADLPFVLELLVHLHNAGLPVPYAIADRQGQTLHQLNGRPALLQPRLPGNHVQQPDISHCHAVGVLLAQLHQATAASGLHRHSDRGLDWIEQQLLGDKMVVDSATAQLLQSMRSEIAQKRQQLAGLPGAVLHADLFRDNVLFEGHHLSGVIDFYNAASGPLLYDVAICVNDWCLAPQGGLDNALIQAWLAGYASIRRFNTAEAQAWPTLLRIAALRFWLSRQQAMEEHSGQAGVLCKDPEHFMHLLKHLQVPVSTLPLAL